MKTYLVGMLYRFHADDEAHAIEQLAHVATEAHDGPHFDAAKAAVNVVTEQEGDESATHGCGMCNGPLMYDGHEGPYATFICAACGQWHISKHEPAAGDQGREFKEDAGDDADIEDCPHGRKVRYGTLHERPQGEGYYHIDDFTECVIHAQ